MIGSEKLSVCVMGRNLDTYYFAEDVLLNDDNQLLGATSLFPLPRPTFALSDGPSANGKFRLVPNDEEGSGALLTT